MAAISTSSSSGLATMVSPSTASLDKFSSLSPLGSSVSITSAASSKSSLSQDDEENMTITAPRSIHRSNGSSNGTQRKSEDSEELRWLAISSLMTELTYSISDVQTRIFEIQELRHKTSTGEEENTTGIIDDSLMKLDEKLENISKGVKSVGESLETLTASSSDANMAANMLAKQEDLLSEWESVQEDSNVLREELKEDKWLTVFRTVTDQADGMMSSLEKAVNRCQEFIDQIRRREDLLPSSFSQPFLGNLSSDKATPTIEIYTSLQESFDAKKKHYMPATTKVLSIIDRGVQDRVTKNGETLRRHAESAQRWQKLRDRMARTENEMEQCRKILLGIESTPSEVGSVASGSSRYKSPPSSTRSKGPSTKSLTRSMSPLRKFARKIAGSTSSGSLKSSSGSPKSLEPVTPLSINNKGSLRVAPSSEPSRNKRSSLLQAFRPSQPTTPVTPDRPSHKHTYSLAPENSPGNKGLSLSRSNTPSDTRPNKARWNSSTKVENESRNATIKGTPRRPPSSAGVYGSDQSLPYKRSLSRTSMASSRPWSPISSSVSNSQSSNAPPLPVPSFRPPSRARTPSSSHIPMPATPRSRGKTTSHIPQPSRGHLFGDEDGASSSSQRSPDSSPSSGLPPRPPSRSMIPIPSLKVYSASRPSSAMSQYRGDDGSPSFRSQAARAQTPEFALKQKVQQIPFYQVGSSSSPSPRGGPRPSLPQNLKSPPSSFRDSPSRLAPSRPGSRNGANSLSGGFPTHEYVPKNTKDPLDMEIAIICNSVAHGLLVERVDPPLRGVPKAGEEIMAQYAFSNSIARKVVTCRLTTLSRLSKAGGPTVSKKVMCRVGGGWQDLQMYLLNRQAGL
ncbi:hypothetical protein BDV98DRAFT_561537 [Pterulicium gracile]|uniref:GAR domain-containing protein n=1 Tax=Pterulicium gracile TaxID=1884261 RepID=A0A5C3QXL7_9AGAR|nr:hypothetical protein BDV98DRAFT_561537 [Pterula gracilis]